LLARFVLEHRAADHEPTNFDAQHWEGEAIDLLLGEAPVPIAKAMSLVQG
jgi:hypothetical protein